MEKDKWLAEQFEAHRDHLQRVAYRMLGSTGEADDAVQEAWLRLSRTEAAAIENLGGWLTTVVARVCLDTLRSRKSRREEPLEGELQPAAAHERAVDPEREAELADNVGLALLVVLECSTCRSRRSRPSSAARRRRPASSPAAPGGACAVQRRPRTQMSRGHRPVVDAFLAAARSGDMAGLLAVLDPDVVLHADGAAVRLGGVAELRGAEAVATSFKGKAQAARPALVDGALGVVVAPQGRLPLVLNLTFASDRISAIEVVADPDQLKALDLSTLS